MLCSHPMSLKFKIRRQFWKLGSQNAKNVAEIRPTHLPTQPFPRAKMCQFTVPIIIYVVQIPFQRIHLSVAVMFPLHHLPLSLNTALSAVVWIASAKTAPPPPPPPPARPWSDQRALTATRELVSGSRADREPWSQHRHSLGQSVSSGTVQARVEI